MKRNLVEIWSKRAEACHKCHFLASHRYSRYNYLFGIPTILFTTLVGTTVFASLSSTESASVTVTIAIGLCSVTAALLSGLQTFLGFSERSDRHRDAGVKYGATGRRLELILNEGNLPQGQESAALKKELDDLAAASPKIPLDILKGFDVIYKDESLDFDTTDDGTPINLDTGNDK